MPTSEMIQLSRRNLLAFVTPTMPTYSIGWVHREICGRLMNFFADVMEKKSPRLILTMPPRHGKSQLVSKHFPSWCFGVNPDISFIAASYSDSLSKRINKDVQRIMDSSDYHLIFPKTSLSGRGSSFSRSTNLLEIPGHSGSFRSTGIGGGITGMGCDILSIDDPLKDRQEANSITIRERVWDWYTSTAYTRLSPGGGVLVTLTRWHEDDLVGRLLDAMKKGSGDQWQVINYPAIAEEDELHRKKGEALHEARYPLEMLERIKVNVGSYDWNSLYQQHPTPVGGGIIKREWIRTYEIMPKVFDVVIQSWDFTFKNSDSADNVAGTVWGKVGANYYLLDCIAEKMDFVSSIRALQRTTAKWPQAMAKIVEDKANGPAIISSMNREISGLIPFNPEGSKEARAFAVSPLFEAGNVLIPAEDERHPWVREYVDELTMFPGAPHDDRVDSTTQALLYLSNGGGMQSVINFL
ncbi:phage terminase large subunit [Fibrobacter sp. UWH4]|uniref:phage terminase large subunit n=1 Tax=Fibrobacter sp. UWH4 TaxID=1896210 RepID=UPI0009193401|nr:phage terminase large subunit [Fibrobacter sp. UWH4]SHL03660.1 phage uncharacterized protein (putative large terminase), C-terminal domain-containing protein [Fibrobacter sp. UWH4]